MKNSTCKLYLGYKSVLVVSIVLVLLFSITISVFATPFLSDPNKIAIFFTQDLINNGSSKYQEINSYNDTNFGIAIPTNSGVFGFRTALNPKANYTFYEVFANWATPKNLLLELTLDRLNDDGTVFRFGAYRQLPIGELKSFNAYLGPGVSIFNTLSNDWLVDSRTSLSIFLQAKANYHITENLFVYGNGMYDFNLNTSSYELGLGFTY
jgi:hypothetical protein